MTFAATSFDPRSKIPKDHGQSSTTLEAECLGGLDDPPKLAFDLASVSGLGPGEWRQWASPESGAGRGGGGRALVMFI